MPVSGLLFVGSPKKAVEKLLEWLDIEERPHAEVTSVFKSAGYSGYFKVYYKIHKKKVMPQLTGFKEVTGGFSGWRWFPIYSGEKDEN